MSILIDSTLLALTFLSFWASKLIYAEPRWNILEWPCKVTGGKWGEKMGEKMGEIHKLLLTPKVGWSWGTFFTQKKIRQNKWTFLHIDASFKPSYWPNARSEPFNGLKTACHLLLQTQPLLSFPALFSPPWHKTCVAVYMCLALLLLFWIFVNFCYIGCFWHWPNCDMWLVT